MKNVILIMTLLVSFNGFSSDSETINELAKMSCIRDYPIDNITTRMCERGFNVGYRLSQALKQEKKGIESAINSCIKLYNGTSFEKNGCINAATQAYLSRN